MHGNVRIFLVEECSSFELLDSKWWVMAMVMAMVTIMTKTFLSIDPFLGEIETKIGTGSLRVETWTNVCNCGTCDGEAVLETVTPEERREDKTSLFQEVGSCFAAYIARL